MTRRLLPSFQFPSDARRPPYPSNPEGIMRSQPQKMPSPRHPPQKDQNLGWTLGPGTLAVGTLSPAHGGAKSPHLDGTRADRPPHISQTAAMNSALPRKHESPRPPFGRRFNELRGSSRPAAILRGEGFRALPVLDQDQGLAPGPWFPRAAQDGISPHSQTAAFPANLQTGEGRRKRLNPEAAKFQTRLAGSRLSGEAEP
jgi:hypothetical protein